LKFICSEEPAFPIFVPQPPISFIFVCFIKLNVGISV
jgi:hypothetical protein